MYIDMLQGIYQLCMIYCISCFVITTREIFSMQNMSRCVSSLKEIYLVAQTYSTCHGSLIDLKLRILDEYKLHFFY